MYDVYFIADKEKFQKELDLIKKIIPTAKCVDNISLAQSSCITKFFWVVYPDVDILDSFNFEYIPDDWSQDVVHVFKNGNHYDGISLIPKHVNITDKELTHRFFINKKEIDIQASKPAIFDVFEIDTYDEYQYALENSKTEMFWMSSNNLKINQDLVDSFYLSHHESIDRKQNHAFVHRVDDINYYNGVFLCSKHVPLSKREIEYRFPVNKKEWDIVASGPVKYDVFEIDTYDEYQYALENSKTEMFWMSSANISADIPDVYFSFDNEYDRKQNHAFVHCVDDKDLYNGVFLCSKHVPLSKREVEFRFPVNKKEWDIVASGPVKYDVFEIDTYDEYQYALENSKTEMFWMSSANIKADIPDVYFSFDNEYDRKQNHAFVHRVGDKDLYNGLFLCSKHVPLSKREVEFRFPVNKKEWDIVASGPVEYPVYEIDSYEEYTAAFENSSTEMFWMSSANISADIPDVYFSFDNEYDRKQNHAFVHRVGDKDLYNGVFLCSKHVPLSKREVEFRFPVNKKEWDIVASGPVKYEKFYVDTYEDYLQAFKNSSTEMFWIIPSNVDICKDFKFDLYFTHDNEYDRRLNHVFLNGSYHDGIILCSKKTKISKRELLYKFIANKKEWDLTASTPKPYDKVFISYQEPNADKNYEHILARFPDCKRIHGIKGIHQAHIEAAKICSTEMVWIIDGDAEIVDDFEFDYQVPAWQHEHVYVWRSKNPINGLVYGYGGVKLFPRQQTIDMDTSKPDMTTSISSKFNAVQELSNITAFNTGEFETWKSAFRECAKLSSKVIDRQKDIETDRRLKIWSSIGRDKPFGDFAIRGAKEGTMYGSANKGNIEALKKINDFDWLKEMYNGNL